MGEKFRAAIRPGPGVPLEPAARALVLVSFALMAIGVLMVYSASAAKAGVELGDPTFFVKRQVAWAVAAVLVVFVTMRVDPQKLARWSTPLLLGVIVLLALVLVAGPLVNGAHRWLRLGPLSFQPSEAAKLALVVWLAAHLTRRQHGLADWKTGVLPAAAAVGCVLALVLAGPDFGTTLFLAALSAAVLLVGGVPVRRLIVVGLPAIPVVGYHVYDRWEVMKSRFAVFSGGEEGSNAVYQVEQAQVAFRAGGFTGRGVGAGAQKLFYLPEAHTDFILPVLGEEMGFVGSALVVVLFLAFVGCGLRVALGAASRDRFSCLLIFGLVFHVGLQAAGNIAVVTGSVPTKGIALPFISLGGSSLLVLAVSVGLIYAAALRLDVRQRWEERVSRSTVSALPAAGGVA